MDELNKKIAFYKFLIRLSGSFYLRMTNDFYFI